MALEIFQQNGFLVYGFLDDDKTLVKENTTYSHVSVLGSTQDTAFLQLLGEKCHPFIALEPAEDALTLITRLGREEKLHPLNALHPSTNLPKELRLGAGNIIHVGSSVGNDSVIHNHCSLMGHVMIGAGVTLHDLVHIDPGAIISAHVTIGEAAYIGSGAIIQPNLTIGARAHIAPGAVVLQDVPDGILVAGNPARAIQPISQKP
ncbi:MAG: acetyltransferase [Bacteroidota bacterium]